MTTLTGESSHHRPSNMRMRPPPSGFVQVGLSPAIGRSLQHVCRYESPKVVRCCRVDSAFAPTSPLISSKRVLGTNYRRRTGDSHLLRNEEPVLIVPAPWLPSWKSCDSFYEISRAPWFESYWIDLPVSCSLKHQRRSSGSGSIA
jgi:hypothetical protein